MTCYKWKYKKLKKINLFPNMTSITLTTVGTALTSLTQFISLAGTALDVIIQAYLSVKYK